MEVFEPYTCLSQVYDVLMKNIPYKRWLAFIESKWEKAKPSLVLDLACGTGTLSVMLAKKGYEVIGCDLSAEMLAVANEKAKKNNTDILFLQQDIRSFELYGTVDAIICACDSLNYILEEDELLKIFQLVKNYLNPGGLFIFDMKTKYTYERLMSSNSFGYTKQNMACVWENQYDPDSRINDYRVNIFLKHGKLYGRYEEIHHQRAYDTDEVLSLLSKAGLSLMELSDDYKGRPLHEKSKRLVCIAQK